MAFRSAWIPAPAPESEPAIVKTHFGTAFLFFMKIKTGLLDRGNMI
jgi:hypothetical protein